MSCDRKSLITLAGTVYSEDFGMLNDTDNEALRNNLRRCIRGDGGKCEWTGAPFYKDLTYEHDGDV